MIPPSRSGLTLRRNKPLRGRQYLTRLMRGFCARWANRISVASTPEYRERRPWRAAKTDLPKRVVQAQMLTATNDKARVHPASLKSCGRP